MLVLVKRSVPKTALQIALSVAVLAWLAFPLPDITRHPPVPLAPKQGKRPSSVATPSTPAPQNSEKTPSPNRLKIPKINVDAPIENVGLTAGGAMEVAKKPDAVAWFELGPRPGDTGSAVFAGHYGWSNQRAAVFNNLHALRPGDQIYAEGDGKVTIFVVRDSRKYNPDADATDVFYSSDNKSHLNLVTCEGTWIPAQQTYSRRLVVFSDKYPQ